MRVFTLHRGNKLHLGPIELKAEVVGRGKVRIYMREPPSPIRTRVSTDPDGLEAVTERRAGEERQQSC